MSTAAKKVRHRATGEKSRMKRVLFPVVGLLLVGLGFGLGYAFDGLLPVVDLGDDFWREFWTGAPAAGVFAIVAAGIAFFAAFVSASLHARAAREASNAQREAAENAASVHRDAANREEWWHRAKWAFGLALEEEDYKREIGVESLAVLSTTATKTESGLIVKVMEALESGVDATDNRSDNKKKRCRRR